MNIEIITPKIFDESRINAGITLKNQILFPETGFTLSNYNPGNIQLIKAHRKILAEFLSIKYEKLKFQKQVHGNSIRIIDKHSIEAESDGMLTSVHGIYLCISVADCCAILIHDTKNDVIAALHAGWRGAKKNIVKNGIELLIKNYQSNPLDLLVWLSPCASDNAYIIGKDVARYFPNAVEPVRANTHNSNFRSEGFGNREVSEFDNDQKYLLNLKKFIKEQLVDCGIPEENIEVSEECTITDERFHSYRHEGDKAGRMAAFISLI